MISLNDTIRTNLSTFEWSTFFIKKLCIGFLLFLLSLLTIFGNLLVLYALRTEKHLRTVSNLFILSLSLADLIVGFIVMPLSAAQIIVDRWPFSYFICQIWLSIDYVASTASIFNLVLLSLDRYWAVVYPLIYIRNRTRKRATHFILIVWFLSFLWLPAILFWSSIVPHSSDLIQPNECDTAFRSNKIFKTLTALGNFYFPLLTMILISCRIMITIHSRSNMEFGRRISSTTQKQMKQDLANTNTSSILFNDKEYSQQQNSSKINPTKNQDQSQFLTVSLSNQQCLSFHSNQQPIKDQFDLISMKNNRNFSSSSFYSVDYRPTLLIRSNDHLNHSHLSSINSLNFKMTFNSNQSFNRSEKKLTILTFIDYIIHPSLSSSLQKELKAARQLGLLVGVFTISWLPYFILFLVVAWCQNCVSQTIYTASIWLGYFNSTLNPLIYPLCNIHFRRAFKKIWICSH